MYMCNIIPLYLKNNDIVLVGKRDGKKLYKKQIKKVFRYDTVNIIIFPECIERISVSFIEGMFYEIRKNIEREKIKDYIKIETSSKILTSKIYRTLDFM